MRFVKRVNERGTTTLPNEVRAAMDIEQGDLVEFEVLNVIKKGRRVDSDDDRSAATDVHTERTPTTVGGDA